MLPSGCFAGATAKRIKLALAPERAIWDFQQTEVEIVSCDCRLGLTDLKAHSVRAARSKSERLLPALSRAIGERIAKVAFFFAPERSLGARRLGEGVRRRMLY